MGLTEAVKHAILRLLQRCLLKRDRKTAVNSTVKVHGSSEPNCQDTDSEPNRQNLAPVSPNVKIQA